MASFIPDMLEYGYGASKEIVALTKAARLRNEARFRQGVLDAYHRKEKRHAEKMMRENMKKLATISKVPDHIKKWHDKRRKRETEARLKKKVVLSPLHFLFL